MPLPFSLRSPKVGNFYSPSKETLSLCFKKNRPTKTCKLASEVDEDDCFLRQLTMAEEEKHPQDQKMEPDGSCHKMVSRASMALDRNGVAENLLKDGPSSIVKACEVEKISRRLNILEEDTKAMKEALFDSLEESRNLVCEINQQFQSISKSHELCNEVAAFMAHLEEHDETLDPPSPKEWRRHGVGLSQIFHHQPNLSLVFKHFKANLLALQEDSATALDL